MEKSSMNILRGIFFCVLQEKENNMSLEQQEDE